MEQPPANHLSPVTNRKGEPFPCVHGLNLFLPPHPQTKRPALWPHWSAIIRWVSRCGARQTKQAFAGKGTKNVIVYRAITLIARSLASVPWALYQKDEEIDAAHPLLQLLNKPNPTQGEGGFMESVTSHLLLAGNAYIEAVCPELYSLRPDRIKIIPGADGLPQFYEYTVDSRSKRLKFDPESDKSPLLHLKFFHPLNDWYGLSPLPNPSTSITPWEDIIWP